MSEYADRCLPHSKPIKHHLDCHTNPCKVKKPCLSVVRRGKPIPCQDECDDHHDNDCLNNHGHHCHHDHHSSSSSSDCHDHHLSSSSSSDCHNHHLSSSSSSDCHDKPSHCVCGECKH